jgi:hypothetical protein
MTRVLEPELLDELPADDARAIHSRRDLRRINALMGNARVIARFVTRFVRERGLKTVSIVEIGAGDENIATSVARALLKEGVRGKFMLVDRVALKVRALKEWEECELWERWELEVVEADVFDWLRGAERADVVVANLFLHHFEDERLRQLLTGCGEICDCFVAAEPRRSSLAEWFAGRVKLVGCNEVTLHDAEISVRAGFTDSELSRLWVGDARWKLTERRAGLFTHFFGAVRES